MQQYLDLLKKISTEGTYKAPARENMPGTTSLFGYQMRFNLQDGFPILTTKKISFKNIVTELLWFLKGDTNIKYLVDNGCNIWNEDAYNYYKKKAKYNSASFEEFINVVKKEDLTGRLDDNNYEYGDCGKQYGWLWRNWENINYWMNGSRPMIINNKVDQLKDLIEGLQTNPMSRRHIITAWNPATLNDMALNACHSFVQFNCRPITYYNTDKIFDTLGLDLRSSEVSKAIKEYNLPLYYLDCQLYQRSGDAFLG